MKLNIPSEEKNRIRQKEKESIQKSEKLGVIISDSRGPTHLKFNFLMLEEAECRVGDFIEVPIGLKVIVGKISKIHAINEIFKNPQFVRDQISRNLPIYARFPTNISKWRAGTVQILGIINGDKIEPPNEAPEPGEYVYKASNELLLNFLKIPENGLYIGKLYGEKDIKIKVEPDIVVRHHIAVLGATGSGKSYTVGVIIEELLDQNFSVVVIDTHGEYGGFDQPNDDSQMKEFEVEPKRYKTIRYTLQAKKLEDRIFRISLNEITVDSLAEIIDASDTQYDLLFLAFDKLRHDKMPITLDNLLNSVEIVARDWKFANRTSVSLSRKLRMLSKLKIFGKTPQIDELIQPGVLTILDISMDVEEKIKTSLVGVLLDMLFRFKKNRQFAGDILVVVEESHRFAPQDRECYSKKVMRRIAREGRKFGIGLCITSQRIVGLDKDIISQCGTKIILKIDSKTDLDYIKPYLSYSIGSDIRRVPLLPTGVAIINSISLRAPVMVNVRLRKSKHNIFT